jgi:hypothetical protein
MDAVAESAVTAKMQLGVDFLIRPPVASDAAFIGRSWLDDYGEKSQFAVK